MNEQILEAVKEGLRVVALAVIPALIPMIQNQSVDWSIVGVVALVAVLRALDKWLHETGKIEGDERKIKGLTQF